MYICPICKEKFENESIIARHSLRCWREHNPNHVSTPAPCKGNVTEREVSEDIINFFAALNVRSKT